MATIKGKWVFMDDSSIGSPISISSISFNSNNTQYNSIDFNYGGEFGGIIGYYGSTPVYDQLGGTLPKAYWQNEAYRTVDFGSTEQTVSDAFRTFMDTYATPEADLIPTDNVSVFYKGEVIGTIEQNNEGIIGCTGETMEDDIIIRVPASAGGGGATVYSIDWDTSDLSSYTKLDVLFLPTSIYVGQRVAGVIFAGQVAVSGSNCDIAYRSVTVPNYNQGYSGYLTVIEVLNPTGDINIVVEQSSGGGSN